jgi:hypothetical protein
MTLIIRLRALADDLRQRMSEAAFVQEPTANGCPSGGQCASNAICDAHSFPHRPTPEDKGAQANDNRWSRQGAGEEYVAICYVRRRLYDPVELTNEHGVDWSDLERSLAPA